MTRLAVSATSQVMVPLDKLARITERFEFIEASMASGSGDIAAMSREYSELRPVVAEIAEYRQLLSGIEEAESMLNDPEMASLAEDELLKLKKRLPDVEKSLRLALLPKDAADAGSAIIEIRPGTGGEEAALFAGDLLRMYQRYAEARGWRFEIVQQNATELGGIKEAVVNVVGQGVFARLKYEAGVHRVQRVPATESSGRIHTSAATVAVLPEAQDVDIEIDQSDLRIDTMRASGSGGQHVNTTDSAVRITHVPTGIVATSSEKSQHQNREIAMQVLRARLYDMERNRLEGERSADRAAQVGGGDRSERIRTYNFPQTRMSDHRIGLTLHKLDQIMQGDLDEMIDALIADDRAAKLAEIEA